MYRFIAITMGICAAFYLIAGSALLFYLAVVQGLPLGQHQVNGLCFIGFLFVVHMWVAAWAGEAMKRDV